MRWKVKTHMGIPASCEEDRWQFNLKRLIHYRYLLFYCYAEELKLHSDRRCETKISSLTLGL